MSIWIDGFNLFHRWDRTRALFRQGGDIVTGQDKALSILSQAVGNKRKQLLVFMDGGLDRKSLQCYGLRVQFCGPGKKADDAMLEAIRFKSQTKEKIDVVSSDRSLAANLRAHGARATTVERFLKGFVAKCEQAAHNRPPDTPDREFDLSDAEVDSWLRYFGEEPDA